LVDIFLCRIPIDLVVVSKQVFLNQQDFELGRSHKRYYKLEETSLAKVIRMEIAELLELGAAP